MKKLVFVMIALLLVGSVSGQEILFETSFGLEFSQPDATSCAFTIYNAGPTDRDIQFSYIGIGSIDPNANMILADLDGTPLWTGEWNSTDLMYYFNFITSSTELRLGESMELKILTNTTDPIYFRGFEGFVIKGNFIETLKSMQNANDLFLRTCIGTTNVSETVDDVLTVFPNPTSDFINISCSEEIEIIRIVNLLGKVVIETTDPQRIDISHLSEGIYFIQVNKVVKKMIIQH